MTCYLIKKKKITTPAEIATFLLIFEMLSDDTHKEQQVRFFKSQCIYFLKFYSTKNLITLLTILITQGNALNFKVD